MVRTKITRTKVNIKKGCYSCQKYRRTKLGVHKCEVLKENIGLTEECWAWTDDPTWEDKVEKAIIEFYSCGLRGRKGKRDDLP